MTDIDKLVEKIVTGTKQMTEEDLQLYVNNAREIEQKLRSHYEKET